MKKLLLLSVICLCICLSSVISRAEEVESNYTFSDFCRYWSNGHKNHHIYSSGYLLGNKEGWDAVNTDLDIVTGKFLVIGEENDEESSSISYALKKDWDFYRNIVYMGDNIPEEVSFEYVMEEELTKQKISEYDLIIIELIAENESLSESAFIALDQLVKEDRYVVFDSELNSECVYTEETDGSVAVIDSKNDCLLISSNKKPGCFENLHTHGSSGNTVTLASIADVDNISSWAYREAVKSVKILPTYNSNIITSTFYKWYDAEEVILPASIDTISDGCFKKYSSLESVNLDHVKVIGNSAFEDCIFSELTIPDSVSAIGSFAFASDSALDILSIHVNENGVSLGKNSFCVNSDTELRISYDGEKSGKLQLFSPFNDNNIEVTADNFADFIQSDFILSFAGIDEDSEDNEEYVVTLVDNKDPVKTYSKQVKNGVPWEKYLEKLSNQEYSNVKLVFKGWIYEDGTIIDEKDIVNLDRDITIYSLYERENETQTYTVNFPEYNKTIEIHYGDVLDQYDIPDPQQEDDIFLGWTQRRPINDDETENILTDHSRWWITSNKTIDLYGVWGSDLDKLTTTETLTMIPNYYLNRNNTGNMYNYRIDEMETYTLDQTSFSASDEVNAQMLINKIVKASDTASKICIVPNDYKLDVMNAEKKGYYIILSELEIHELERALTLMNCKYFQYLLVIQTPYVEKEESLNECTGIGYRMKVTDWEIKDAANFDGWVYGIDTSIFMKYYNICNRVNMLVDDLVRNVFKFNTQTTITDALKAINNYAINFTAYDNPKKIYDLKWFLEETSKNRNLEKEASHHGVCASYSKLAYAVLGRCGYETLPCSVWESNISYAEYIKGNEAKGPVHSINKVIIGGKDYYCDFTWAASSDPMRYMFLTLEEVNRIRSHYNPVPDDYGIIIKLISADSLGNNNGNIKPVEDMMTITLCANGGSPEEKVQIQKKGQPIERIPVFSKKGYILKGWYTKKSGGKKITASTKITSNIILYAHWSKVTVKKAVIKSVKSQKKKTVTVKYKKISGAEGYQIQYSTSRNFTKQKTKSVMVKGNKSFTKNLTKLKKKTYYIRVRAYKKDSTKAKVYGKWSTIKKIKSK